MSALVRITTGIMPQHSRVGMSRAMAQFGEVIHCHKPPYSGIPGEDFVNVRFGNQAAADRALQALKAGQVMVDGYPVGTGAAPPARGVEALTFDNTTGGGRRRSISPARKYSRGVANQGRSPPRGGRDDGRGGGQWQPNFPSRRDPKSLSPRRMASGRDRSRSRDRRPMERENRFAIANVGHGGGMGLPREVRARTPSPDPLGPAKHLQMVRNPFFRRSCSMEASDEEDYRGRGLGMVSV
mmetsp:Transcript_21871/g.49867  ORF Transcript_21871/g.49867 Transcript_21871/m.49867 type:complete len:240 (+) Transcript_21871:117-836(+)